MPPRPTPPSSGKPRRRPVPAMPGGWLLLLLLLGMLLFILFFTLNNEGVAYGDFMRMFLDDEKVKHIKKIVVAQDHMTVEVDEKEDLPDEIKKHVSGSKSPYRFQTKKWPVEDPEFTKRCDYLLSKKEKDQEGKERYVYADLKILADDDHMAWLGPLLGWVLLPVLLAVFFFVFILPRFRDPLGGGFLSSYIKSPARRYDRSRLRVTFDDVADMQNAKNELTEIVEFLRSPEK